jgi:hypothetical protein
MITLILSGGPWTEQQQKDILDYCESDVLAAVAGHVADY